MKKFYIYYEGEDEARAFELTLTENMRKHVLWTVRKIRAIMERGAPQARGSQEVR